MPGVTDGPGAFLRSLSLAACCQGAAAATAWPPARVRCRADRV